MERAKEGARGDGSRPAPGAGRDRPVLVTGATGYIGGRLVGRLLDAGWRVRCLVRDARKLAGRPFAADARVEVIEGDMAEPGDLGRALAGSAAAFWLVHSMIAAGRGYADVDRNLALGFARGAAAARLPRIIYLGGLGEVHEGLSEHLRSRREVEEALASTGVPVTVLRAAMIIGSGSASFEILRYLVERLPVMVTPRWVKSECQPIAVDDVLRYLVTCLDVPETSGRTLDIGGTEILTYRRILDVMAEARGLRRRLIIPVPVLTPRLSSWWIHLVTPVNHRIARPLAEGLRNRVVCRSDEARRLMPGPLLGVREAIDRALRHVEDRTVETTWSAAGVIPGDPGWAGGTVYADRRSLDVKAAPAAVFRAICRVGGGHGWYAADFLWRLRGFMDRLVGGPGLRRGRRHPDTVAFGDALDFWRVVAVEPEARLVLRAEMRLPGVAELEFDIAPAGDGASLLTQVARFRPKGLFGILYWYFVLPFHAFVFRGLIRGIRRTAEAPGPAGTPGSSPGASAGRAPSGT